jgi:hypothetical protein
VSVQPTLPMQLDEVTPEWLVQAMGPATAGSVRDARLIHTLSGTADKLIFALEYDTAPSTEQLPSSVCVKGGFNEATRQLMADGYIAEARFFDELAPSLEAPVPRCWYSAADPGAQQGIVVLDDLGAKGCRFGDPLVGLTVDEVASGLEAQAAWHAGTWNEKGLDDLPWLEPEPSTALAFYAACLAEEQWEQSMSALTEEQLPVELRDPQRIEAALRATLAMNAKGPRTLAHGDAHIGNTYVDANGVVGFLDWQTFSRGGWADDVAYFIVGALDREQRQESEWELLDHYCAAMSARGVSREELGDVRQAYRCQHLHGMFWGLLPPGYQPPDKMAAMCRKFSEAMLDHETLAALGV